MQGKYFLLVLMITFNDHIASSHILTSSMDMSLPTCMKLLTYTVMNDLCPTYGAYADYSSEEVNVPPTAKELAVRKWELRENLIKKCCNKPCTLPELLSIC